jgi:hypothetical protein
MKILKNIENKFEKIFHCVGDFFYFWRIIYVGVKSMKQIRKTVKKITEKKEVYINLEDEKLKGNVLDVSLDNQGIIYNLCKNSNEDIKIEYIQNNDQANSIINEYYDIVALFFTIERLGINKHIKGLLEEVTRYLKVGGQIIIWDLEKSRWKYSNFNLNVLLPGKNQKSINIKNYNIFKETSGEKIKNLLEKDFDIIELISRDNIYYIRGNKKGRTRDESSTNSD